MKEKTTVYCEQCDAEILIEIDNEDVNFDFRYKILCLKCKGNKWIEEVMKQAELVDDLPF